jgi:hypothetical protein
VASSIKIQRFFSLLRGIAFAPSVRTNRSVLGKEQTMQTRNFCRRLGIPGAASLTLLAALPLFPHVGFAEEPKFTSKFRLQDCQFDNTSHFRRTDNPYFPLKPGYQLVLEGEDGDEEIEVRITVLQETQDIRLTIGGEMRTITTRVVEEREYEDDELVEVSRNFFARCENTNDIFYFGEDVDIYENGRIVSHDGAWRAGRNGARPGIIMPGTFLLGARYFQEIAPRVALDRGENVEMGLRITTPAGTFSGCVKVVETSPLDSPGNQSEKVYCPGVGMVIDNDIQLTEIHR